MKDPITTPGKTYAVTSPNGCTVTQHVGEVDIVTDVPAGVQTLIIAHASRFEIDDDSAIVTECGGSAELVFTAATTRAASSGTGSDGGFTSEERALLMGAAQRGGDNTFTASNTFTGAVDMSTASVTPPEGWNVGELTPEAIQQVVPMAWGAYATAPTAKNDGGIAIGDNAISHYAAVVIGKNASGSHTAQVAIGEDASATTLGIAIGKKSHTGYDDAISVGRESSARPHSSIAIGANSKVVSTWVKGAGISIGAGSNTTKNYGITIGQKFSEWFSNGNKTIQIDCSTSGEQSVSIGCGTNTKGAISTTIGAAFVEEVDGELVTNYCTTEGTGSITIGAGANTLNNGDTESSNSVTIGCKAENKGADSVVIGAQAKATAGGTVAIGAGAEAADAGAVVFASYSTDRSYKTQLYFSGAGSALSNTYANGEGIMGYVTTDSAGNVIASGYKKLSALFDEGSMTQPATLDEFGDWVMPKVFQPGKGEPQEYTPLPVYPIVEPEIPEMEEV